MTLESAKRLSDWLDAVDRLADRNLRPTLDHWPAHILDGAPKGALSEVALEIDVRALGDGSGQEDVRRLRLLLQELLGRGKRERASKAAIRSFLDHPGSAQWNALVATIPESCEIEQARWALLCLTAEGTTVSRVVMALSRRGPGLELAPIAATGLVCQFDFVDRADRTSMPGRERGWLALAILAAKARGHACCVGLFQLDLERGAHPRRRG